MLDLSISQLEDGFAVGDSTEELYLFPTSFAQRRLWFLAQLNPSGFAYNLSSAFRLKGALDVNALRQSFAYVQQRHEILRTTFMMVDGELSQVVWLDRIQPLPIFDFRRLSSEEVFRGEILKVLGRESARTFDLENGPLFRMLLFVLSGNEYIIFYTAHHIITDAWSERVLINDLMTCYGAFEQGGRVLPDELPLQYGDFAKWQHEWLQGEVLSDLLAFWKEQIAGAPTQLDLFCDYSRPSVFTYRGARESLSLEPAEGGDLVRFSANQGATLFTTILSAFGILLQRYSRQLDVLVGSPVANRSQEELELVVGLFVNTLILRLDMRRDPTFESFLKQVTEVVVGAHDHQEMPFERLVSELDRDQSRNPLIQVVFNMDVAALAAPAWRSSLDIQPVEIDTHTSKFDLALNAVQSDGGVSLSFEYNIDLFAAETIRGMLLGLRNLLREVVENPGRRLSQLSLISREEIRALVEFQAPCHTTAEAEALSLDRAFDLQVERAPQAVAVVCGGESLTYEELSHRSEQLAAVLKGLISSDRMRAGLCLDRSIEMVVAILATLKSGAAYVPLDPEYPHERLSFLLEDSQVPVVVSRREYLSRLEGYSGSIVLLDELPAIQPRVPTTTRLGPDSPAYVIYTSGSTGRPKGVVVHHSQVLRLFESTRDWFHFEASDVWTLFHSFSFDFSVWEIWGALLYGGRLVIVPFEVSRSPERFLRLLREEKVTVLNQTPSAFYQLDGAVARLHETSRSANLVLRYVVFGGEALNTSKLNRWFARFGAQHPQLINMYGITETVVHTTFHLLEPAEGGRPPAGSPIGVPLPDLGIYVLDPAGHLGRPGMAGEMYIGGAGVSSGYLARPGLTAARFVPDPFGGRPGARLYRSGDLGRRGQDGRLTFLGRVDHQVQVRGFRVEPGEIVTALLTHPAVSDAAVVTLEVGEEQRLVAYLVSNPGLQKPNVDAMRGFLISRLPEHMIPSFFIELDAIPLTPHGKVDRQALPAPGGQRPELAREFVAPRTPLEEILASVWATTLGIDQVGIHDNFFSLGGDSILSIQALALARGKGIELSLREMFSHPTIAELAPRLAMGEAVGDGAVHTEPLSLLSAEDRARLPEDVEDAYPLSQLQAGMLYHILERPDSPVFHNINSWHLRMELDADFFQRAVLHVTARHPNLRTSFDMTSFSEPLQLVHREPRFPVDIEDLSGLSNERQEEALAAFREREMVRPFDLSRPPQLRFTIHRRGPAAIQFTLTENHAIIDGWSLHSLYHEILTVYFALLRGRELPALPPLETTYRDFVYLERQILASKEAVEFWDRELRGARVLKVPRWPDYRRDPRKRRVKRCTVLVPVEVTEALHRLSREEALPLKSILLAVHMRVMGFFSGQTDVLSSVSGHGRPETHDGSLIGGLFVNTQPLRLRLTGGTWKDLARWTQRREIALLPFRRYPLAAIQERWGEETLLETSFVHLNFHVMESFAQSGEVEVEPEGHDFIEEGNFAVMTSFHHGFGNPFVHLDMDCDRDVLSDTQVEALGGFYIETLAAVARCPLARYESFAPFSRAQRHALEVEWNDSERSYPSAFVHDLFSARARETPDRLCLVGGGESHTFGALDRRANRLAHHLRSLGVGPEVRVALCLDRSPETMVALLGVLKAGGAYVPLDLSLPRERLAFMVRDSGAALILTRECHKDLLAGLELRLVFLDWKQPKIDRQSDSEPAAWVAAENLAYVIYTSGSTGQPKGVAIEHRHLVNYLNAAGEVLQPAASASFALVSTFAADLGHTMVFMPLVRGGCVYVFSEDEVRDPNVMTECFERDSIDYLKIVPSHLSALLVHPRAGAIMPRRGLILGGEALDQAFAQRLRNLAPACRIFNEYGPTETTVAVTIQEFGGSLVSEHRASVSIGRAMGNSRIYIVDAGFSPPAVGAPGELLIGGANVGRGYLGRPALTAEKLVPDPFGRDPGARAYRSGDRARWLPDGSLDYLGRLDHQVKIRGFRVELGEVETAIQEHPAIREAVVLVRGEPGEGRLIAYVTARPGQRIPEDDLRHDLTRRLPSYMVPNAVVTVEEWPLTPNGKLDVKGLPEPGGSVVTSSPGKVKAARDPVEVQLLHIWEEILGKGTVGINDDFFGLGGNSLLAVRLIAQIRRRFQHQIPLSTLLEARTVEQLAGVIRSKTIWKGRPSYLTAVQPRGTKHPIYLVHPGHGTVVCYLDLAHHLGHDQPVYGFQALDVDYHYDEDPYISVERMAARYVADLREFQPHGPYLLGGWSFGGLVAFEMARQLLEKGEEVPRLLLLDCSVPVITEDIAKISPELLRAYLLIDHARDVVATAGKEPLEITPRDIAHLELRDQLDFLLEVLSQRDAFPLDVDREMLRRYFEVRLARIDAMNRYRLQPYPSRITLFRTTEESVGVHSLDDVEEIMRQSLKHESYGWSRISTRPVDVVHVPGHHESMVREPLVRFLAEELSRCLAAVAGEVPATGAPLIPKFCWGVDLLAQRSVVNASELLSTRLGWRAELEIDEVFDLAIRCKVLGAPPGAPPSLIVKRAERKETGFVADDPNPQGGPFRLFNEWAGMEFLTAISKGSRLCPRLIAGDRERGFLIMEDFGSCHMDELLMRDDAEKAEQALIAHARRLAEIHVASRGRLADYARLRDRLGSSAQPRDELWGTEEFFRRRIDELGAGFERLGFCTEEHFFEELEQTAETIAKPGPFLAYTHGHPIPSNLRLGPDDAVMIDFALGYPRHALIDALCARMLFPTGWRINRIPERILERMESTYRAELARVCPEANDDELFEQASFDVCVYWLITKLSFALRRPLGPGDRLSAVERDHDWGISSLRQIVLASLDSFLGLSRSIGRSPSLAKTFSKLARQLDEIWGSPERMPFYPAFRGSTEPAGDRTILRAGNPSGQTR